MEEWKFGMTYDEKKHGILNLVALNLILTALYLMFLIWREVLRA
jgi:hypothetical protein